MVWSLRNNPLWNHFYKKGEASNQSNNFVNNMQTNNSVIPNNNAVIPNNTNFMEPQGIATMQIQPEHKKYFAGNNAAVNEYDGNDDLWDIDYSSYKLQDPNMDSAALGVTHSALTDQTPWITQKKNNIFQNDIVKKGITNIKKGGKKILTPLTMMMNQINPLNPKSSNFNPMLEGQLENYKAQGFRVNDQGQAIDGPLAGKNLVSGFGTNDVTAMLRKRLRKLQGYKYQSEIKAQKEKALKDSIKAQVEAESAGYRGTPDGNVGSGVFAKFDQSGKTYGPYTGWEGKPTKSGASKRGNYGAAVGTPGAWSPGAKKDGGRIGYLNGELVGEETDFIQGPRGDEEFQETVVEGQEQPSREQLEALAMEIFQLPLEELDDQQLLVVYQEAMQGQPMEEAVQEDEIQYAARGGRAGYRFGEEVEQQTDFLEGPQDNLMASGTSFDDDRNQLSLQLFGKEIHLLNEIEMEQLEDEIQRLMGKFMAAEGGLASIL